MIWGEVKLIKWKQRARSHFIQSIHYSLPFIQWIKWMWFHEPFHSLRFLVQLLPFIPLTLPSVQFLLVQPAPARSCSFHSQFMSPLPAFSSSPLASSFITFTASLVQSQWAERRKAEWSTVKIKAAFAQFNSIPGIVAASCHQSRKWDWMSWPALRSFTEFNPLISIHSH